MKVMGGSTRVDSTPTMFSHTLVSRLRPALGSSELWHSAQLARNIGMMSLEKLTVAEVSWPKPTTPMTTTRMATNAAAGIQIFALRTPSSPSFPEQRYCGLEARWSPPHIVNAVSYRFDGNGLFPPFHTQVGSFYPANIRFIWPFSSIATCRWRRAPAVAYNNV